ncbi:MAG TPA: DUF881 domain-containing protein [Bacilli bacterium]|nr:DUF881 domain-containing protein [Bacilli bacterium]
MEKKFKWSLFLVSVLLGCMLTVQFSTVRNQSKLQATKSTDAVQLSADLIQAKERRLFLYSEIANLNNQIENYKNKKGDTEELLKEMADELEKVKMQAGASDVQGNGLIIKITEEPGAAEIFSPEEQEINGLLLGHALYSTVNYLSGNGAQAISINGHRITSLSSIRSVSATNLQVNMRMIYTDKIEIRAIGNIEQMKVGILGNELPVDYAGIGKHLEMVEVKDGSLLVPKYDETVSYEYAKPEGDNGL